MSSFRVAIAHRLQSLCTRVLPVMAVLAILQLIIISETTGQAAFTRDERPEENSSGAVRPARPADSGQGCGLPGDVNNDGVVDVHDLQAIAERWRARDGEALYDADYDFNDDGLIDLIDVLLAADWFGQRCDWPDISLELVASGLNLPLGIVNANDGSGRLFVVGQRGFIWIIKDGTLLETPFLDIRDRVSCCHERGLLGLAFPPDFASAATGEADAGGQGVKNHFYIYYTDENNDSVLARYHVTEDPDIADTDREEVILTAKQPSPIHNGGQLAFGPNDGYLYIALGDGGPGWDPDNNAQNPETLLGNILRIDVETGSPLTYTVPSSNPFTQTIDHRGEIWALGLRNPWRFSFDRETADLYIADVGESRREEINFQPASSPGGENYGWRIMEGSLCFIPPGCDPTGFTLPVHEYSIEGEPECAVIGGYVYRGSRHHRMEGIYFYGDYCSGRVWGLRYDESEGQWVNRFVMQAPFLITSFGEHEDGEIYVTNYDGGSVYRLLDPFTEPERDLLTLMTH